MRFYDPNTGAVRLDGKDIRELPLREYRSLFGVVLQEAFLFDDTIAANLRCGKPDATGQEVRQALVQAQALEFVERLSGGLDYRVGEAGANLSGGQRQRLAIARCMLCRPRFLVLDEATSALDNESERLVQKALEALFRERTAFIIAHRLSTIRRVDRILVLDEGRLVEDGDFGALVDAGGLFSHLHAIATSTSERRIKLSEAGFA
jgi:ATP-binding cassette subfamily B protein